MWKKSLINYDNLWLISLINLIVVYELWLSINVNNYVEELTAKSGAK